MDQGSLDVKYLEDRYNRGLARVESFMRDSQRYMPMKQLEDSLPDILQAIQNPERPATCLVAITFTPHPRGRHVILIIDLSVWPTRSMAVTESDCAELRADASRRGRGCSKGGLRSNASCYGPGADAYSPSQHGADRCGSQEEETGRLDAGAPWP